MMSSVSTKDQHQKPFTESKKNKRPENKNKTKTKTFRMTDNFD